MKVQIVTGLDGSIHAILPPGGLVPRGPGAASVVKVVPRADQRVHEVEVSEGALHAARKEMGAHRVREGKLVRV
jgi:hypothetical protein